MLEAAIGVADPSRNSKSAFVHRQPYIDFPCPESPPQLPIPGHAGEAGHAPTDPPPRFPRLPKHPHYMGTTFPSLCGLWAIMCDVGVAYSVGVADIAERVPPALAEARFHQLLAWSDTWLPHLARTPTLPTHAMVFQ